MAKVFLICGRICSGKSTYAKTLAEKYNAVILSTDEIMLAIFGPNAGNSHDFYVKRAQAYLYQKSLEFVAAHINVILDFGFWTKQERESIREFYQSNNVSFEFHYLNISYSEWERRLTKRNAEVSRGEADAYFVDEGLKKKCEQLFEQPNTEEIHTWIEK